MKLPGFTAEAVFYQTSQHYQIPTRFLPTDEVVVPQDLYYCDVGPCQKEYYPHFPFPIFRRTICCYFHFAHPKVCWKVGCSPVSDSGGFTEDGWL
jgi:hypothetical protein